MNRSLEIVVLSKFPEYFAGFRESIENDRGKRGGIVVWDQPESMISVSDTYPNWLTVRVHDRFHIARNANIGFGMAAPDKDILYVGDDVRFTDFGTVEAIQGAAYSDPQIGILSPKIIGLCASDPTGETVGSIAFQNFVGFVCVYLKREMLNVVGTLDQRYENYGVEDCDFCLRARRAGFKIGITGDAAVRHGVNGKSYGSTFIRVRGEEQMGKDDRLNWTRFATKWKIDDNFQAIMEFIRRPC